MGTVFDPIVRKHALTIIKDITTTNTEMVVDLPEHVDEMLDMFEQE